MYYCSFFKNEAIYYDINFIFLILDYIRGVKNNFMKAGDKLRLAELTATFLLVTGLSMIPLFISSKPHKISHSNLKKFQNTANLKKAYLIKTKNNDLVIVKTKNEAEKLLAITKQYLINRYKLTDKATNIALSDDVNIVSTKAKPNKIAAFDAAEKLLTAKGICNYKYKVSNGENLWDISIKNHIDIEKVLDMNPGADKKLNPGDTIKLYKYTYKLGLKWNEAIDYNEKVLYSVVSEKTNKLLRGRVKIQSSGQYGLRHIVGTLTKVNGVDVKRQITTNKIIKNPVSQKQLVGTSLTPPTFASGTFSRPVLGMLSSRFGFRWGKTHKGVDLAASYGSNVRAADGGKVIYAGWESGYGNFVQIDHENGYVSCYGHCSKLCVTVGQRVYAGEKIAEVGSTGHSTGPHLHFEVRKNGVPVNPWPFINKFY